MSKRILVIQGHPDATQRHLGHALAQAYSEGALAASHIVRSIPIAELDFPLLRSQKAWEDAEVPLNLRQAQEDILWAEHLALFFPLWLGDMPALGWSTAETPPESPC